MILQGRLDIVSRHTNACIQAHVLHPPPCTFQGRHSFLSPTLSFLHGSLRKKSGFLCYDVNTKIFVVGALRKKLASQQSTTKEKKSRGSSQYQGTEFFEVLFPRKFGQRVSTFVPFFFLSSFWHVMLFKVGTTKREEVILVSPTGSGALQLVTRSKEKGENRTIISFPPFTWYFWIFQTVFP